MNETYLVAPLYRELPLSSGGIRREEEGMHRRDMETVPAAVPLAQVQKLWGGLEELLLWPIELAKEGRSRN
jgi:hypothetical protein